MSARPLPRLAWLAAAVIALLVLGAALVAGSRFLATIPPRCPPWSAPDVPGPASQARPPATDFAGGALAWDRSVGRMIYLARTATGGTPTAGAVWTFDVCANEWHLEREIADMPDRGPVVSDEDSGLTVAIGDTGVWTYDLVRDAWARRDGVPPGWIADAVYDPVTGLVVGRSTQDGRVWTYDVEADTWREVAQKGSVPPAGGSSGFQLFGYDRVAGRAILTTEAGTWLLDPRSGVWERSGPAGPVGFFIGGRQIAYDEAGARTLVYGEGTVTAYDALTQGWEVLAGDPPEGWGGDGLEGLGAGYAMAFDPLNDRLVVVGGTRWQEPASWVPTDGVIAFDPATGEWRELLAPSTPSGATSAPSGEPTTSP